MKRISILVAILIGMTAYVGNVFAGESPMTVDGAKTVNAAEAKALFDKGIKFVDVRKNADWDAGRIPGAQHIELKKKFSEDSLAKVIGKDQAVVIYCNGALCKRSSKASIKAVGWGFKQVYYFRDGFPAWQTAGYPAE